MGIYTDLAKEIKEGIPGEIDGVLYCENEDSGVTVTRIEVVNKNGEARGISRTLTEWPFCSIIFRLWYET